MSDVKKYAQWSLHIRELSQSKRLDWVSEVIGEIRKKGKKEKNRYLVKLADMLEDKDKVEFVGFMPYFEYMRAKGSGDQLEVNWLHALGNPALFVKLKGVPVFMIVSPALSWGKSDLPVSIDGATG